MVKAEALVHGQLSCGVAGQQLHCQAKRHDGGAQQCSHEQPVAELGEGPKPGAGSRAYRRRTLLLRGVVVGGRSGHGFLQ
jgi:hypothetical protein